MTAHYAEHDGQQSAGDDRLRAADEDRQWVADRLRAALDQGRLRLAEYDDRLQLAYRAQTYAELNLLLDDLPPAIVGAVAVASQPPPAPAGVPSKPTAARAESSRGLPTALLVLWIIWGGVVGINLVTWLLVVIGNGHWVYPWPAWVAGPSGIALLSVTIGVQEIRRNRRRG
jgi:hypothetical protein